MTYLSDAADRARRELERRPPAEGSLLLRTRALPAARPLLEGSGGPRPALIAEARRTSPFPGSIGLAGREPGELAERFQAAGAAAVAVVTEGSVFDGSVSDIRSVRRRTSLPILQRDAFVHPAQIIQGRAEGADAVALVAGIVSRAELRALAEVASDLGMDVLVQIHADEDPQRAIDVDGAGVLVNARRPEDMDPDWEAATELAAAIPGDRRVVMEGGIRGPDEVARCGAAGARAVVVGTALMRAVRVEEAVSRLMGG